jgi:hypothetical protein
VRFWVVDFDNPDSEGIEGKQPSRSLLFDLEIEKAMDVDRNNLII